MVPLWFQKVSQFEMLPFLQFLLKGAGLSE